MTPSIGTMLKVNVHLDFGNGFTMDDVDFVCQFYTNASSRVEVVKDDMIRVDEQNYVALVDTDIVGAGDLYLKATAFIPDTDIESGLRKEVVRGNTGIKIVY